MKKAVTTTVVLFALLLTSCMKEKHSIRLKNDYGIMVMNVVVGTANLGNVNPQSTSGYKSINTGNFTVSGTTSNGMTLTGSGTISGKGEHHWTMTLNSAGQVSLAEDKK